MAGDLVAGSTKSILLFLCVATVGQSPSSDSATTPFFQEPKDRAVFAGEHARFSCATNYDISIQWRMYGANLNELIINGDATVEEKTGTATNRHHLTLKILGRAIFNGTKLQCVTQDGQVSRVATLYVKGALIYVENLTSIRSGNSLSLVWRLPYPLNETNVEIWFQVHVQNVTDKNEITSLDYPSCFNITKTTCTLVSGPCDQLAVTVIPYSIAGPGNSSQVYINRSCTANKTGVGFDTERDEPKEASQKGLLAIILGAVGGGFGLVIILLIITFVIFGVRRRMQMKAKLSDTCAELVEESLAAKGDDESELTARRNSHTSDTPALSLTQGGGGAATEGEDEGNPERKLVETDEPSNLPPVLPAMEAEVIKGKGPEMDKEKDGEITADMTEGNINDSAFSESTQEMSNAKQGDDFVHGQYCTPVTEIQSQGADSEAVTFEESCEESTEFMGTTSEANKEGQDEVKETDCSQCLKEKPVSRTMKKTGHYREHSKVKEPKESMEGPYKSACENTADNIVEESLL